MMTGREKLYFLLERINDIRELTPSGQPLKMYLARNLNNKYDKEELISLLFKLEKDEKVIKIVALPEAILGYKLNTRNFVIELLAAFDDYYTNIQHEPAYQEFTGKIPMKQQKLLSHDLSLLHPTIFEKCQSLFEKAAYAEAVEKSFKIVKDRLRTLTSFESGSDAFGRGNLHIKGAAAPNVDHVFNQGVKFLTMAIDNFRNEKTHTSDAKIDDPQRAYEYLSLSSLAMHLLDQAEVTPIRQ
jgi:uncharacterized protein (TIGR02391 family)